MGMFDSLYAKRGTGVETEWQTKAYHCGLDRYYVGDDLPEAWPGLADYQVEVLGGEGDGFNNSFATVRGGTLVAVHVPRDESLPRLNYWGHLVSDPVAEASR